MTQEEIISMAREAGGEDWGIFRDFMPEIERFAKLIFTEGFFAGFNESGEGFNGEFPYGDKGRDPRKCKAVLNCLEETWGQQ